MSDKDREALPSETIITAMADTWAERTGIAEKLKTLPSNLPTAEMRQRHDELVLRHVKLSYEEGVAAGWQAARGHYAPKVKEKEAVEVAAKAIQARYWKGDLAISIQDAKVVCTEFAEAALKAAGVKFREEA